MSRFITRLAVFMIAVFILGEFIVRYYRLTSDIPRRYIDETGIQRYIPGQTGYFKDSNTKWKINDYGWTGVAEVISDQTIAIIGDSYIENMMNPISCNQGVILKSYFNDVGFFEAGRSGVTFIEGMEITKLLDSIIQPKYFLIYVSSNDFYESISNKVRYSDRLQIDLINNNIERAELKFATIKRILYGSKLLYYMYLRFPLFVSEQNKGEILKSSENEKVFDYLSFNRLLGFCEENYSISKIILVFHPGTEKEFILLSNKYGFKTIELNSDGDESWALGGHDGHWSCYGQNQVAAQVENYLSHLLKSKQGLGKR